MDVDIVSDFFLRSELIHHDIHEVKIDIGMFKIYLDTKKCVRTLFNYCVCIESPPNEFESTLQSFYNSVHNYHAIIFEIREDIVGLNNILSNREVFPDMLNVIYSCREFIENHIIPFQQKLAQFKYEADDLPNTEVFDKIDYYKLINEQLKMLNGVVEEFKEVLKITLARIFCRDCYSQDLMEE